MHMANRAQNENSSSYIEVRIRQMDRSSGGGVPAKDMLDSMTQMTEPDDLYSVHVNVPADAKFLIQEMRLCFTMFILLPETSDMLRNLEPLPNSVAIDFGPLFL